MQVTLFTIIMPGFLVAEPLPFAHASAWLVVSAIMDPWILPECSCSICRASSTSAGHCSIFTLCPCYQHRARICNPANVARPDYEQSEVKEAPVRLSMSASCKSLSSPSLPRCS
eukprot:TRINITY_DN109964_c0_g1_i1.p1 TRINITY_DN109964_c0_g1~~TRINITY_DN109964_c0_g1_i1.p1  ORF type:complete len:114 (+),score=4.56 TRINITY_DN109964_c0_g1_i1:134-475(+)